MKGVVTMKKKSIDRAAFLTRRTIVALIILGAVSSLWAGSLLAFLRGDVASKSAPRTLTFAERVAYERAIEDVYWRHRVWPNERSDPKPSLDAVMSQAQLEKKVADYLRKSQALEDYWQRPITAGQLQAEMDRMAKHTKQPQVLRELFEALGNDPFVIAECLARPALADRLLSSWYAHDERIHRQLRRRAEADLAAHSTVEQMKQLSGNYSESELIRSDSGHEENRRALEHGVQLNSRQWDEMGQKLAAMFGDRPLAAGVSPPKTATLTQIETGVLSPLQEDETRFYATAVLEKTDQRLKLATVSWLKEPLQSWLATAESQGPSAVGAKGSSYDLPEVAAGESACVDGTWTATDGPPDGRDSHTAVWTGSEMIVWGGFKYVFPYPVFNTGGRYNPSTDSWTTTSMANAPSSRYGHTAVWTGNEMIVWGGSDFGSTFFNTGGRYNPNTDTWAATSTVNAPDHRTTHTAVWTDGEMIVWGGYDGAIEVNTGGRYNPGADSWTATSSAKAPA